MNVYLICNFLDLAIDDISNIEGECPGSGVCTFQEDLCSWINGQNGVVDDFDWLRNSGATSSLGTGPTVDHTFGTPEGLYQNTMILVHIV
jgi:hypothetical protein